MTYPYLGLMLVDIIEWPDHPFKCQVLSNYILHGYILEEFEGGNALKELPRSAAGVARPVAAYHMFDKTVCLFKDYLGLVDKLFLRLNIEVIIERNDYTVFKCLGRANREENLNMWRLW